MERLGEFKRVDFVESIPHKLEYGTVYIDKTTYGSAVFLSPDGSKRVVNVRLKPAFKSGIKWKVNDGVKITFMSPIRRPGTKNEKFTVMDNKITFL